MTHTELKSPALTPSDFFKGTGDEMTGRLQARNRILLSFITVACTLIGVSAAERGFAFVGVGVGFLSLATTLLSQHHEFMIAHLVAYQKDLIASCIPNAPFPTWHAFRADRLERTRSMRDRAQLIIHSILGIASLLISGYREYFTPTVVLSAAKWVFWVGSLLCLLWSLWLIHRTRKEREKLAIADKDKSA